MRVDLRDITWESLNKYIKVKKVKGVDADAYKKVIPDTSFHFWELHISELIEVTKEKTPKRLQEWISEDLPAYDYIARLKGWMEWLKTFFELMEMVGNTQPETDVERYVKKALPEMKADESILTFTRGYFGMTSFEQAEQVTLGDYYLARKDDYIRRLAEKKAQEWHEKEMKKNKRMSRRGVSK